MFYDEPWGNPCAGADREIDNYITELDQAEARVRDFRLKNERLFAALVAAGVKPEMVRRIEAGESA